MDTDEVLVELMEAAIELGRLEINVPYFGSWRFLSNHFLKQGKKELAVQLAQVAHKSDKKNPFFIVQFAKILRMSAQPESSVELFRNVSPAIKRDRTYFFEWAMSEGMAGFRSNSVCLAAAALADNTDQTWPNMDDAARAFAGMGKSFAYLYDSFDDRRFIEACSAAVQLGLSIKNNKSGERYFEDASAISRAAAVENVPMPQAFERLLAGIGAAWERHESDEWIQSLPPVPEFRYTRLRNLLRLA
jgi:hypothetical protein